jgi:hypothetical protein
MKRESDFQGLVCTSKHYAIGRHYRWEAATHEAGDTFKKTKGRPWTYEERREWIDGYLAATPYAQQQQIVTCAVCEDVIAEAVLRGESPFQVSEEVKAQLASAKARVSMPDAYRYRKTKTF